MHKTPKLINTHWLLFLLFSVLTVGGNILIHLPIQFRALQARGAKPFMPFVWLILVLLALGVLWLIDVLLLIIAWGKLPQGPAIDPLMTISDASLFPSTLVYLFLGLGLSRMLSQVKSNSTKASDASDPHFLLIIFLGFFYLQYKVNQFVKKQMIE